MAPIKGLMDPGHNKEYQALVREAAWKGILEALKEMNPDQLFLRNEDIVEALMDIQALVISSSNQADSPTKLRKTCEEFAKRLRFKTLAAQANDKEDGPLGEVIHLDSMQ
ncbi:hypothetical protein [Rhizobium mesoamericanum]|uniref:Uncharacterized protein n=1 Tax=Rhizobium mesoamericanum STM3625 TaxID=1211777 RepID=K0PXZ7_9HYPH|nr:hypothetical protein [Rhizobium mesoamericanum]CCM76267.1 hypothetical protein BN77_0058 [Rhizobium mesoamericanum STM3625]